MSGEHEYEYKYTDKEYEVMMMKKEIKEKIGNKRDEVDEGNNDMGELVESDDLGD